MDYSINYYAPLKLLIATMKYTGNDYEGDMKKVGGKGVVRWLKRGKTRRVELDGR